MVKSIRQFILNMSCEYSQINKLCKTVERSNDRLKKKCHAYIDFLTIPTNVIAQQNLNSIFYSFAKKKVFWQYLLCHSTKNYVKFYCIVLSFSDALGRIDFQNERVQIFDGSYLEFWIVQTHTPQSTADKISEFQYGSTA